MGRHVGELKQGAEVLPPPGRMLVQKEQAETQQEFFKMVFHLNLKIIIAKL